MLNDSANLWITSDHHFLHSNIAKYCNRPENFNKILVNNWNSLVHDDDIVLHLGDFSAGVGSYPNGYKTLKIISASLKGTRFLIRGNHDHKPVNYFIDELWFSEVYQHFIIDEYFFTHYPLVVFPKDSKKIQNKKKHLLSVFKKEKCRYVIHGHTHAPHPNLPNHFNVCVDLHGYSPVLFSDIKKYFHQNKEIA